MATKEAMSNAGIRKLSNGQSVIPASTRADGSVRKEIRVKPGYRPPEDVEVYKNRTAEAWKSRGKGGVPGAEPLDTTSDNIPAVNKNAKRREARKRAAANGPVGADASNTSQLEHDAPLIPGHDLESQPTQAAADAEADAAKEARKLHKKLRQARELKDKKENGDSLLPEQFAKVIKIQELIRQLDKLGFDANGEKKEDQPI